MTEEPPVRKGEFEWHTPPERNTLAADYVASLGDVGMRRWLYDAEWHANVYIAAMIIRPLAAFLRGDL